MKSGNARDSTGYTSSHVLITRLLESLPIPSCRTVVDGPHNTSQVRSLIYTEGNCRTADDVDTDSMYAGLPLFGMQSWTRNT